jgi:hypothetical protein
MPRPVVEPVEVVCCDAVVIVAGAQVASVGIIVTVVHTR